MSILVNSRLAYVAISRARYDAQVYTNDAGTLANVLSRAVTHAAGVEDWKRDAVDGSPDRSGEQKNHGYDHTERHGHAMEVE